MNETGAASDSSFKPALLVIDFQYDFCPPNGALAVSGALDLTPTLNELLQLPFALKIATKDFHPKDHISFASNHPAPNNKPFESQVTIHNPHNDKETDVSTLWPDHCVQGTPGCDLVKELDQSRLDHVIEKGQDARVEMYSAFAAPFTNPVVAQSGLRDLLENAGITHVYVVALATDYCVKSTAIDAAKAGFKTYVVLDATRAIDASESGLAALKKTFAEHNVGTIKLDSAEMERVKQRGT